MSNKRALWIAEGALFAFGITAMCLNYTEIACACAGAFVALIKDLINS